ncbi:MAG TPA: outer membrane beta-barrel protein [Chitinophagaceae bacterium]|nr:outer membrane beta-barrel protein [Chitinophagaceae bacterium]
MLQKIVATGFLLSCFIPASSQDLTAKLSTSTQVQTSEQPAPPEKIPSFTFSGSADVYYRYDFAKTRTNNFTSFTNSHNSFELGMASARLDYKHGKVSMVADLGFGKRAKEFSYNDEGITAAIKQLFVTYAPADWIKFTAGSWATHVGYELVDPQLNRNYSMSYMFTNGPFFHTGAKADLTAGKHGFMIGIANPTDLKSVPDGVINRKFILAQYSLAVNDNTKLYFNYVGGKGTDSVRANQFDLVVTGKLGSKLSIGYNGTVASVRQWDGIKNISGKSWWGSALYLGADPKDWFGLTLRAEYFNDEKQLKVFSTASEGGNIFATTLSANFKVNALVIIPEVRIDHASKKIFTGKSGMPSATAGSFLLAMVYAF